MPEKVVLIVGGGLTTQTSCIYDLCVEIYGSKFIVTTFLDCGQSSNFRIRSNVIRLVTQRVRSDEKFWELICSMTSDP